jgi:hypothetical protein
MASVSDNFPRKEVCSDHVRYSMFIAALHQEPNTSVTQTDFRLSITLERNFSLKIVYHMEKTA